MLRIKRVPTVVSNYQKEETEDVARRGGGCGRNCLNECCIQGAQLPLYAFKKLNKIVSDKGLAGHESGEPPVAFLDSLLLGEWEDRMQRGLFRYDVTACETKVIPGNHGFIAQLNEGRHLKKRPTEFRVDKVLQPFDGNKFNFTKVGQEEVLFQFEASDDGEVHFFPNAPVDVENSPSVVAINVSPIEYGHVLLVPRILECLPQKIDHDSFLLALHMAAEAGNPYFRLGFNSLGAFATINHLHFQAYYLAVPFPIEKAPAKKIATLDGGVKISKLLNYPVRGLVFEGGYTVEDLSNTVSDACICLQANNIPYNVLIADCGRRVFLLPQCYAEKQALGEVSAELLDTQVNPAVWEISGHMVLKRKKDYEEASEENAWRLLAEVSLSEARFEEVCALIFEAIEGVDNGLHLPIIYPLSTLAKMFHLENHHGQGHHGGRFHSGGHHIEHGHARGHHGRHGPHGLGGHHGGPNYLGGGHHGGHGLGKLGKMFHHGNHHLQFLIRRHNGGHHHGGGHHVQHGYGGYHWGHEQYGHGPHGGPAHGGGHGHRHGGGHHPDN